MRDSVLLDVPHYISLASLGFVMSHEIHHTFSHGCPRGRCFLGFEEDEVFSEKQSCLSLQYSEVFQRNVSLSNGSTVLLQVMSTF